MKRKYRHVVIGAGAIGSAAALRLAERSEGDVLVLEQFPLGHDRGSSNDHSRIIRHAYQSAAYTALTPGAYASWEDVERRTGLQLVLRTGGLDLFEGQHGAEDLRDYFTALDAAAIPYEMLDAAQIRSRYPQWRIRDDVQGMFQADGGILDIRRAVAAQVSVARELGVTFAEGTRAVNIDRDGRNLLIRTDRGNVEAETLTLATGSWAPELLSDLGVAWPISLSQEQVSYFAPSRIRDFLPDRFPIWVYHGSEVHYGFPVYGEVAVKLARDDGKKTISLEQRSAQPNPEETRALLEWLALHLPEAVGPEVLSKTCVYDMPPDKEFIVDVLPGDPRITVALGGSGHGGKFAALLGQVVADLATTGTTTYPIDIFRADRPALSDPDFPVTRRLSAAR